MRMPKHMQRKTFLLPGLASWAVESFLISAMYGIDNPFLPVARDADEMAHTKTFLLPGSASCGVCCFLDLSNVCINDPLLPLKRND
jgi:hypothetical protein